MNTPENLELLTDPVDGTPVKEIGPPLDGLYAPVRADGDPAPVGLTEQVVYTEGGAYPVVEGVPVLLAPERLHLEPGRVAPIAGTRYAGAYGEQALYTSVTDGVLWEPAAEALERIFLDVDPASFPDDIAPWLTLGNTGRPYELSMRHLGPVSGAVVLQVGGIGSHALKLLHAGASTAVVVSPVMAELLAARRLADHLGVADRLVTVAGMAEELPVLDDVIDAAYSGSSLHHTDTALAIPELARVLRPGGRFASVDVWKGTFHSVGTKVFGKRHGANCRPLDGERVAPVYGAFDSVSVSHHGAVARYPIVLLARVGIELSPSLNLKVTRMEDALPLGPLTKSLASLICVRGEA